VDSDPWLLSVLEQEETVPTRLSLREIRSEFVLADKPLGEWNHFRILMLGDRVTVSSSTFGFSFNGEKPDPLAEIARLRRQLKGDPSDAECYLRLGRLYSKAEKEKESPRT
jgi:hypothetical protein